MQFSISEEQQLIRDTAREFFDEHATSERVRAALESGLGYDAALWQQIAGELGWAGIAIPECYGGAGLGMVELAIVLHEQGRRLVPSPFFSTVCLAAPLILRTGNEIQRATWLGRIARGEARVAVALSGAKGDAAIDGVTAELRRSGSKFVLNGASRFVVNGHACDALLVAARTPASPGRQGVSLALIDAQLPGVSAEKLVTLDLTRPMAHIRFNDVLVETEELLGPAEAGGAALEYALDLARVALAAEAVGGAEWTLDMTTDYVKERVQFGRPVGSFQAVKHRLADMMVLVEAARSASLYAACAADEHPEELAEAASIAKSACCDAFYNCAANAIQLHGGIGFTWEHDAHLYFKRARAAATLLGSPSWHRERLARIIGLGQIGFAPAF